MFIQILHFRTPTIEVKWPILQPSPIIESSINEVHPKTHRQNSTRHKNQNLRVCSAWPSWPLIIFPLPRLIEVNLSENVIFPVHISLLRLHCISIMVLLNFANTLLAELNSTFSPWPSSPSSSPECVASGKLLEQLRGKSGCVKYFMYN